MDWLNKLHEIESNLSLLNINLMKLSDAFYMTGNNKIADKITSMAINLKVTADAISSCTSAIINEGYSNSNRISSAMLELALHNKEDC